MGTQKLFMLDKGFLSEFMYREMFRLVNSVWVFLWTMINLLGLIKYISRSQVDDDPHIIDSNCSVVPSQQNDQMFSNTSNDSDFCFSFQFQTRKDDDNKVISETESSAFVESEVSMNSSKYQVVLGKDIGGFIEEPETMSFTVQELFSDSSEGFTTDKYFPRKFYEGSNHSCSDHDQFIDRDLQKLVLETEAADQEKTEDPVKSSCSEDVLEGSEQLKFTEHEFSSNEEIDDLGIQFDGFSISTQKVDSGNNDFFSELESDSSVSIDDSKVEFIEICERSEEIDVSDRSFSYGDEVELVSRDKSEDTDDDDEYIEIEPHLHNSSDLIEERELVDGLGNSEEQGAEIKYDDSVSDEEEDILLEHENLIEQMKMEMKNARTGGLATILEESETPKMVEDLKPLKIDEKFEHRDRMGEIQKFYKSYADKMRKLDVLNYQTMQAISFLHLKDPVRLNLSQKTSVSVLKSLTSSNFWPCKLQKIYADPALKSVNELHRDLEVVYVGQVCLSWEILNWQLGKARELMEYDSQGGQSYNQVADEFQQFQVHVQRFIEDEPFQGPRIQNYVKKRCIVRSLLQVPSIKDDCLKDKKGKREEEEGAISIAMLAEILKDSTRVFWEFLHADKDDANLSLKGLQGTQVDLQDPADSQLLMDIKTNLEKKEKKLKEILRSGNCIVKKFQKHQGGRLVDRVLLVSQVELRLVSRVLNLSRLTTDQLVWCQTKLNNINFVNRKIHVEPSFLLFPC